MWQSALVKVLVSGGCGFIGSNLTRRLISAGHGVRVLDDLSTGYVGNIKTSEVELITGSILDPDALARAVHGADTIVHLAALGSVPRSLADPLRSHDVNTNGTLAVLEAARATGVHVIYSSSSSVYGSVADLPRTESLPTRPMSPYGASKLAAEAYCLAYGTSFGLPVLPFRFFNVYGPRQAAGHAYAAAIPVFVDAALRCQPLPVDGDGLQTRDFTYVDTVTGVLADAVERRVTSDMPVNLAIGASISLLDVIAELEHILGRPLPVEYRPPRTGDVRASQSLPTLLRDTFPDIEVTPFAEGLAATVDWFCASGRYAQYM